MPSFESPIGRRQVSGNKLREFDVPDGEDDEHSQFNVNEVIASGKLKKLDIDEIRQFQNRLNDSSFNDESNEYVQNPQDNQEELRELERARYARTAQKRGIERLSSGAKKRLEMLIGMTRSVKSVEINGTEYELQTLKSQEMREALLASSKFEHTVEFAFEIRLQFLARSLVKIGGISIDQFISDSSFDSKLLFINELDEHLLSRLYTEYTSLAKEATEKFAIKTASDAEGVVADLKK